MNLRVSDSNSEAVKIQHIADGPLSKSLLDSNVIIEIINLSLSYTIKKYFLGLFYC